MAAAAAWDHVAARCLTVGCPSSPEVRAIFGCDGEGSGYALRCWVCFPGGSRSCPMCGGEGSIQMTECPRRLVGHDVIEVHHAFQAYRAGFLPCRGGMLAQAHVFVVAARLLDSLYGMHERIETEKSRGR